MKKDFLECGKIVGAHGVKGLMKVESNYRAEAKSTTGYGICQINPSNLS